MTFAAMVYASDAAFIAAFGTSCGVVVDGEVTATVTVIDNTHGIRADVMNVGYVTSDPSILIDATVLATIPAGALLRIGGVDWTIYGEAQAANGNLMLVSLVRS